jgi:hypothetical protein
MLIGAVLENHVYLALCGRSEAVVRGWLGGPGHPES